MTGIHQSFQAFCASIGVLWGKREGAVIAPVALSGELCHRHQLQCGYPELTQIIETGNYPVKCAVRGKGSHMQLIHEVFFKGNAFPIAVVPGKARIDHLGRAMHTVRLAAGSRVGTPQCAVQPVPVTVTRCRLHQALEIFAVLLKRCSRRSGTHQFNFD